MSEESMELPEGKICFDCFAFNWCSRVIGVKERNTKCDYYPVRFRQKKTADFIPEE